VRYLFTISRSALRDVVKERRLAVNPDRSVHGTEPLSAASPGR
jgi:hypothetical protein